MKLTSLASLIFIVILQTACGSGNMENEEEFIGLVEPAGITSYQYGTHTLKTESSFYALRSNRVELENYEGLNVKITASEVEGYPLDGGPVFLQVETIKER